MNDSQKTVALQICTGIELKFVKIDNFYWNGLILMTERVLTDIKPAFWNAFLSYI